MATATIDLKSHIFTAIIDLKVRIFTAIIDLKVRIFKVVQFWELPLELQVDLSHITRCG